MSKSLSIPNFFKCSSKFLTFLFFISCNLQLLNYLVFSLLNSILPTANHKLCCSVLGIVMISCICKIMQPPPDVLKNLIGAKLQIDIHATLIT